MRSEVFMSVASTQYLVNPLLAGYQVLGTTRCFILRRQCQPKPRNPPAPRHVHFGIRGIRQIQRLAMLAPVDLGIRTPGFFRIAASLFDDILGIEPALQMPTTEFALLVFLVTRALPSLLDLHLVMRKLRRSLRSRSCNFASRQRTYPRLRGACADGFSVTNVIVPEG